MGINCLFMEKNSVFMPFFCLFIGENSVFMPDICLFLSKKRKKMYINCLFMGENSVFITRELAQASACVIIKNYVCIFTLI